MDGILYVKIAAMRNVAHRSKMRSKIVKIKLCKACNQELEIRDFYCSNSLLEERLSVCKDCISKKVNIYDLLTFIPILQIVDVPYIQDKRTTYIVNILARNQEPQQS